MKHWNLGNTTVRNPERIKEGLKILKTNFEGKPFNYENQLNFFQKLVEKEVYRPTKEKLSLRTKRIGGRKWAACFNQLGFTIAWKKKGNVKITDVGNQILLYDFLEEEIYLKQFMKYRLPSPIEKGKDYKNFDVIPFYVVLRLLSELDEIGINGLTREEIGLYVITCIRNDEIEKHKELIIRYRKERNKIKGSVKKKEFFFKKKKQLITELYREEFLFRKELLIRLQKIYKKEKEYLESKEGNEIIKKIISSGKGFKTKKSQDFKRFIKNNMSEKNIGEIEDYLLHFFMETKGLTLNDYADTTIRYTIKTGLLSIKGDKLIIKQEKKYFVKKILELFPWIDEENYIVKYRSVDYPKLPSDNIDFLKSNLVNLKNTRDKLRNELGIIKEDQIDFNDIQHIQTIKKFQNQMENEIKSYKEKIFYINQSSTDMIEDILKYYDKIIERKLLGGEAYRPAYLEWTTWRLFLAINDIYCDVSKTRNFQIDEELNPIHHARSGEPDMVFEYTDFVVVCEVTLRTKGNQYSEEEPVQRHVGKIMRQFNKDVFCIFIAPSIDPDTYYEFHKSKRYINNMFIDVTIIPITISQIKDILMCFNKKRFNTKDLKQLLVDLKQTKNYTEDPLQWGKMIASVIEEWVTI